MFLTGLLVLLAGTLYLVHGAVKVTAPAHGKDAANGTTAISLAIAGSNARSGVIDTRLRWPGGVVHYRVATNFSKAEIAVIKQGTDELKKTCVKVKSSSTGRERDYVYVTREDAGCSSYVGRLGGRQDLNLDPRGCIQQDIVTNQFIHALGFYNEHQRPDRDDYVTIHWENIEPEQEHNFDKYGPTIVSTFGVPYDYESIMHFPEYAYSKNGQKTIVAKDPRAVLGGSTMTALDIEKINKMYNC